MSIRRYKKEFLKYGFSEFDKNKTRPFCLICQKDFSNAIMKSNKLKNHLTTAHPEFVNNDILFFQKMLSEFDSRVTLPNYVEQLKYKKDLINLASYHIS